MDEETPEVIENNGELELKPSAWFERTSSGKIKFGCKARRCELADAVSDVLAQYEVMKEKLKDEL